jgi:hypothetical protein
MPITRSIRSPARVSMSGRMIGIPPPTAASNRSGTPDSALAANSSGPRAETSSLLAVTTGRPAPRAARTSDPAGSMPPITSTTRSMASSCDEIHDVVGEHAARHVDAAGLCDIAHRHPVHLEVEAGPGAHRGTVDDEPFDEGSPYRARPGDPDPDGPHEEPNARDRDRCGVDRTTVTDKSRPTADGRTRLRSRPPSPSDAASLRSATVSYIVSGAVMARRSRTARMADLLASTSHRRAWVRAGSSVITRQSV